MSNPLSGPAQAAVGEVDIATDTQSKHHAYYDGQQLRIPAGNDLDDQVIHKAGEQIPHQRPQDQAGEMASNDA